MFKENSNLDYIKIIREYACNNLNIDSERFIFSKLQSSLDVFEDTQSAIDFYFNSSYPNESGGRYLYLYGLLQAAYLQQDAVNSINHVLLDSDIDFEKDYPNIYHFRSIRNDIAGHPTNRKNNSEFIHITQTTVYKNTFLFGKKFADKNKKATVYREYIDESVNHYNNDINKILFHIVSQLNSKG